MAKKASQLTRLLLCLLIPLLSACEIGETQQIFILQQQSVVRPTWDDVILVYGFADNGAEAESIREHYASAYKDRSYRIVSKAVSRREYEKLQKRTHIE